MKTQVCFATLFLLFFCCSAQQPSCEGFREGFFEVLTPDGKVARYLFGVEYAPRDLRLALVEAADRRIGSAVDAVYLACYRYDAQQGRYSASIMKILRVAAILTVVALVAFVLVSLRQERHRTAAGGTA